MILKAAEHISTVLNDQAVVDALGSSKVFWELAEQDAARPFATYSVSSSIVSKSRLREYDAQIRIYDSSLTAAATKAQAIEEYIEASELARWKFRGSNSGYTSAEAETAYIELNYNFKL
jgi:SOS response regulatory protein OraA/RecX